MEANGRWSTGRIGWWEAGRELVDLVRTLLLAMNEMMVGWGDDS